MKKKLTAMVLALGAMFGAFEAGAALAGNGTKADPYRIGSYGDLVAFAAKVNGGETNACAVLSADITATGTTWTPIGNWPIGSWDKFYVGTFDGQNHTISDLSNASVSPSPDNAGLFGFVGPNGIVRNVNLVNVNIAAAEGEGTASGGVVGINGGTVKNCSVSGVVKLGCYSGGIVGLNATGVVEGCCNTGKVIGYYDGGIVGLNYGGVVKNCYNTGAIDATGYSYAIVGGVVGQNGEGLSGSVENCYNIGSVTGVYVGGVVCINDSDSKLLHSYSLDSVAGGAMIYWNEGNTEVVDVRALSEAEFRVQSNFTGWDFDEVWKMGDNAPKLRKNYDVTYNENWIGGAKTKKELDAGDGILANAPADPKREGWYFCGWFTESEGGLKVTGETVADGDATYYAHWGRPAATFAAGAVSSSESKTVKLTVYGGSLTGPSSVKVFMTYQTAAAADLDFANATVNGEPVKGGLKFPLTLAWDTGDMNPVTIEIPVKADKSVEDGETFTFQIADVIGTEMDETLECTVTLDDPGYAELRGRIEEGTATKAESNTWTKASHDGIPYMRGLAYPADGGKVTGSAYCPENKKVTLKASANKGFTFLGWTTNAARSVIAPYPDGYFVATTASLVIDRTTKPAKDTKTSTTISNLTESTTFYAVFEGDPRVTATPVAFDETKGLFVASEGGKVTGAGRYAPGKKVTLKATANKGYAFSRWENAGNGELGTGKLGERIPRAQRVAEGDALAGVASRPFGERTGNGELGTGNGLSQSASYTFEMTNEDVDLYAVFVTVEEDAVSIAAGLNGGGILPPSEEEPVSLATNVWAGVYLQWPVAADALSQTTVKVSGLPSGLKFTAKDIMKKGSKTEVEVPANTIYGAPTAASKLDKNGKPVPSNVKVTVTTAGKSSVTYAIALTVDALPAWAVGSFDGEVTGGTAVSAVQNGRDATPARASPSATRAGPCGRFAVRALRSADLTTSSQAHPARGIRSPSGVVSLTIATSGKISGKILESGKTWTLSAAWFDEVRRDGVIAPYQPGALTFVATVIAKAGKEVATNVVTVAADAARPESAPYQCGVATGTSQLFNLSTLQPFNLSWTAYQNLWKRADTKAAQPVFKKNIVVEYYPLGVAGDKNNTVKFTFKKDGAVSFSGKIGGVSVSGSAQLVLVGRDDPIAPLYQMTVYAPPKKGFDGWCETFPVKLTMDEQNIVTKVELGGEEPEMVQLWEGGPYWATKNIGAEKPEDSGYYFWWGDTIGYKWENEQFVASDGSVSGFSFSGSNTLTWDKDIATLQNDGWITSDVVLALKHDAAHVHWGGDWRMPTYQEVSNIVEMCDYEESTQNGVKGWIVRGRGDYSANSIFIPWVGSSSGTSLYDFGSFGYYWSSVPGSGNYGAYALYFTSGYYGTYNEDRDYGLPIRPVQSPAE